jgi:YfiR/HmsC-like
VALSSAGWLRSAACAVGLAAAAAAGRAPAQAPGQTAAAPPEYQVKAVFLFHFAQFVTWPGRAFTDSAAPLVIGILGDDPFGPYLDEAVRGEAVEGHPLTVRRFSRLEEIAGCHILFVPRGEMGRLREVLQTLQGHSVLTVSDAEGFTSGGGMIRFLTDRSRIRLRINLEAARSADLTLSSKLLRPAEIVGRDED